MMPEIKAPSKDKQAHASLSFLGTVMLYFLFGSVPIAVFGMVAAGVTKEVWDYLGNGTADVWDLVADMVGILIGIGAILLAG